MKFCQLCYRLQPKKRAVKKHWSSRHIQLFQKQKKDMDNHQPNKKRNRLDRKKRNKRKPTTTRQQRIPRKKS